MFRHILYEVIYSMQFQEMQRSVSLKNVRPWFSPKGGFPPSRSFYMHKYVHVHFTLVNKKETMYGKLRVHVKVEPRSTLCLRLASCINCLYFIYAHNFYVRIRAFAFAF